LDSVKDRMRRILSRGKDIFSILQHHIGGEGKGSGFVAFPSDVIVRSLRKA
jgi:hypothetical protein